MLTTARQQRTQTVEWQKLKPLPIQITISLEARRLNHRAVQMEGQ
jgi:hypothetical protein